jgi:hypothetical protein
VKPSADSKGRLLPNLIITRDMEVVVEDIRLSKS